MLYKRYLYPLKNTQKSQEDLTKSKIKVNLHKAHKVKIDKFSKLKGSFQE